MYVISDWWEVFPDTFKGMEYQLTTVGYGGLCWMSTGHEVCELVIIENPKMSY